MDGQVFRALFSDQCMPVPPGWDASDMPSFGIVRNRLKVLAGLDPVTYAEPRTGTVALVISGNEVDCSITAHDADPWPRVEILLTAAEDT